jgi:hypothetical protein
MNKLHCAGAIAKLTVAEMKGENTQKTEDAEVR